MQKIHGQILSAGRGVHRSSSGAWALPPGPDLSRDRQEARADLRRSQGLVLRDGRKDPSAPPDEVPARRGRAGQGPERPERDPLSFREADGLRLPEGRAPIHRMGPARRRRVPREVPQGLRRAGRRNTPPDSSARSSARPASTISRSPCPQNRGKSRLDLVLQSIGFNARNDMPDVPEGKVVHQHDEARVRVAVGHRGAQRPAPAGP